MTTEMPDWCTPDVTVDMGGSQTHGFSSDSTHYVTIRTQQGKEYHDGQVSSNSWAAMVLQSQGDKAREILYRDTAVRDEILRSTQVCEWIKERMRKVGF